MEKNNNKKVKQDEKGKIEETTQYGEFISSYFEWITPEEQKEKAKKLQDL